MDPQWHVAFLNISITQYAGMTYRDYYSDAANTLDAQLKAADVVERRFGVGRFITPRVDSPSSTLASLLGMPVVFPEEDEVPWVDTRRPLIADPGDVAGLRMGDPKVDGSMALRWRAWQYYRSRGYEVALGGPDGSIVTTAGEISNNQVLTWLATDPNAARAVFGVVLRADRVLAQLNEDVAGGPAQGAYIGDDFAGMLSPEMFREFVVPYYRAIYTGKTQRFMHSELLRVEHLRVAKDMLDITDFHGAGAENLTLAEMREVMGHAFWAQLTPHELIELAPPQIEERIKEFAGSGAGTVQLYPGRGTPDRNLDIAINACRRECAGGPRW